MCFPAKCFGVLGASNHGPLPVQSCSIHLQRVVSLLVILLMSLAKKKEEKDGFAVKLAMQVVRNVQVSIEVL